jgi:hypothetical protein
MESRLLSLMGKPIEEQPAPVTVPELGVLGKARKSSGRSPCAFPAYTTFSPSQRRVTTCAESNFTRLLRHACTQHSALHLWRCDAISIYRSDTFIIYFMFSHCLTL